MIVRMAAARAGAAMADRIIVIERRRHDAQHWIRPAPPTGNAEQQYRVCFDGRDIGSWRYPEGAAARWLLAQGKAERSDTLQVRRLINGLETPSLFGNLGWFADHTISESDTHGLRVVKWRPIAEGAAPWRRGEEKTASDENRVVG